MVSFSRVQKIFDLNGKCFSILGNWSTISVLNKVKHG